MDACLDYIYERQGNQQEIMLYLHEWIISYPNVVGKISYKIPVYYRKRWICYLNPFKNDQVELVFTRANELSNEQGLLDFRDRKLVAGIIFAKIEAIPIDVLHEIFQEALLLDDDVKYALRRKANK